MAAVRHTLAAARRTLAVVRHTLARHTLARHTLAVVVSRSHHNAPAGVAPNHQQQ